MVQFVDPLIGAVCGFSVLVLWRWLWLKGEQRKLLRKQPENDDDRFEVIRSDEDDQTFYGRVIRRLRSRIIEGRVEIHWQFNPEFIHRGFLLTGKCRRNDRSWEPLAFEPHQDSGSWIECFNYGESRSYLFTIRKTYRFFFGLLADDEVEVVYDQISFSLRKGKFLKEKAELLRDRTQVMREAKEYTILEAEIRAMVSGGSTRKPAITSGRESDVVSKLQDRFARKSALADFVETKREEIQANRAWSDERKRVELERLEQLAEEASLEDSD